MTVSAKHVSSRLRDEARTAIDAKRKILERWSRKGIPRNVKPGLPAELEWFPTSLRTFCAWDGSQNSSAAQLKPGQLRRTAYQTLAGDDVRLRDVLAVLKALAVQAAAARKALDPILAAKESEGQARLEREKRAGALLGYRRARKEAREHGSRLLAEQRAHQHTIEQLGKQLKAQDAELVELRAQLADVTAMLRKTAPIRSVR
jgi:ribosomal protein L29